MHCVFLALFSCYILAHVFLMNLQKGLIQINWEHGERGRSHVNVISKTRFWNHTTQQQMRSRTSNTHRCNRHEQSFGGGKRIGSIRTSLHLQNREKHPKFQHFWHMSADVSWRSKKTYTATRNRCCDWEVNSEIQLLMWNFTAMRIFELLGAKN